MGAYEAELSDSSPGNRLGALIDAVSKGARWSADASFVDLATGWDSVVDVDSFDTMNAATKKFDDFCRRPNRIPILPPELFTSLADARATMLAAFLADPDAYVDPLPYLAKESSYPLPSVGMQDPSGALGMEWTDVTPKDWTPTVPYEATITLVGMALLSDAIFLRDVELLQPNAHRAIERWMDLRVVRIIR